MAIVAVLLVYNGLHLYKIIQLPINLFILVNILIPILFIGGAMIMRGVNKDTDSFAQRFMILTTFQLLTNLFVIAIVWSVAKSSLKQFGLQFISIFIVLMMIQSVLLVRVGTTKNES